VLVLNERHQVHVVLTQDDEDASIHGNCNDPRVVRLQVAARLGTVVKGTVLGIVDANCARDVQEREGKQEKATVSLTVALLR